MITVQYDILAELPKNEGDEMIEGTAVYEHVLHALKCGTGAVVNDGGQRRPLRIFNKHTSYMRVA